MILRLAFALRLHWKRLALGAFLAWLAVNCFFVVLFVVLESRHVAYDDYDVALAAQVLLMAAIPGGALIGYATRGGRS